MNSAALGAHVAAVWAFLCRMTLSQEEAEATLLETFERALHGHPPDDATACELWLLKIASYVVEKRLPQGTEVDFGLLDETLRSEATRTQEVGSLLEPEREYLLWSLKQGCMTAVINCLSPGERVAFVLSAVMDKSDDDAAAALGIKVSAFKVRLSRAKKKIGDYLAPRCEHVDPGNPCRCPSRIGIALRKGFIAPPNPGVVQLRPARPFSQEIRSRDAVNIFRTLPAPEVPPALAEALAKKLTAG